MASSTIAGASCVGKSAFDRAEILRDAHAHVRDMRRYGGFNGSYRAAFASALRLVWHAAKEAAADAAWEAAQAPIPAEVAERIADLRAEAWWQPFTTPGAARHRALMAEADDLAQAARCSMIPAQDTQYALL